jgi:hypothetical protein
MHIPNIIERVNHETNMQQWQLGGRGEGRGIVAQKQGGTDLVSCASTSESYREIYPSITSFGSLGILPHTHTANSSSNRLYPLSLANRSRFVLVQPPFEPALDNNLVLLLPIALSWAWLRRYLPISIWSSVPTSYTLTPNGPARYLVQQLLSLIGVFQFCSLSYTSGFGSRLWEHFMDGWI